ncbi:elongation factor 1-beta [Candidatus Micrarchaeota archaeon]|nr:elongation factor 1-beta [Candidatus Micrarchaeota archaeon]
MADVVVNVRISTEDQDRIQEMIEKIKEVCRLNMAELEDVGFGIKVIKAQIFVEDKEEGFDEVEERIKAIEGISEIDVLSMDRQ